MYKLNKNNNKNLKIDRHFSFKKLLIDSGFCIYVNMFKLPS